MCGIEPDRTIGIQVGLGAEPAQVRIQDLDADVLLVHERDPHCGIPGRWMPVGVRLGPIGQRAIETRPSPYYRALRTVGR